MITLYGIHNCDTVKKASAWLGERGLAYRFHDFRADGLDPPLLERMERALGWEGMLNRRGTTWRNLAEADRHDLDRAKALRLMLAHPTVIKRPVLEINDKMMIGFSPDAYTQELCTP